MTTITRPGPTNLQNEPGYELDLLWDQMADVVEATEVVANAALPAATAATTYAPIAKGVTNGDSHNHDGGDGGQIAYSVLSGLPTLGTAAALNVGTAASNVVQLNGSAQLPAVDGSLLTNLPGGGVTDHSALTGLSDDDHSQYHTDARGDARYAPLGHANSTANPHSVTAAQAGADAAGTAAAAVSAHAGGSSVHAIASVSGLETALSGKSPTSHDHAATYAPIANGVTNGDSHDHNGGDGGQIAYANLSGLPTLGTAAALNVGTGASQVVQLTGTAQLPAVDGSLLTGMSPGVTDHGALTGLADDDHSQYPLGAGRASGQTLIGGTQAADSLTLQGTLANGTGTAVKVRVGNAGATEALTVLESGYVGVDNSNPPYLLSVGAHGVNNGFSVTNDGRLSLGQDVNIGWTSSAVSHPATAAVRMDMLDDGTFSRTALATHVVLNPPANSSNTYRAGHFYAEVPASNTVNPGNIYCASAYAYHYGSGTLGINVGLAAFAYNRSTGTITTNIGYQNQSYNYSTGTITANYSTACLANNQSSGTIGTNKSGEFIARNSGTGTITTNTAATMTARNSGAGSVTNNTGVNVQCFNTSASGIIATQVGIDIGGPNSAWSNLGTITDSKALLIGASTDVGTTTKAIHSDSLAQSYLAGGLAIGLDSASAKLHSVATTEQLRIGYDADTYVSFAVDAAGLLTVSGTAIVLPDLVRIGASDPGAALSVSSVDQALPQVEIRNAAKFDYVLTFLAAGSVWADITAAMSLTKGAVSADLLDVVGDFIYVGLDTPFSAITLDIGTARSATASSSFEYSTGAGGWSTLTVTDGTVNLTVDGTITFTPPGNWASDVVNGSASVLWVRIGTVSGTFTAEPTAYTIVPGAIRDVVRVLANALDTIPALEVDNLGGVNAGRAGSTTSINEAVVFTGTSVTGIGTLTVSSSALVSKTSMAQVSADGVTVICGTSSTALRPHQQSPRLRYTGTFWDFQSATSVYHNFKTECVGDIGTISKPTRTRLVTGHVVGATPGNFSELMTLSSDGTLEVLGTGLGAEVFSNGEFTGTTGWTVTGDWLYTTGDYTFTYSTGSGTLTQASASYATPLKPNTYYKFSYGCGVSAPSTTNAWIGTEVALYPTYFTLSTTEYPVYFKTNSAPTDFTIYTTATATSGFRLDDVSLKEVTGGDIIAHGLLQSRGGLLLRPPASVTPTENGDLMVEATSNTSLTFKYKGSDGTVRSGSITLS